MELAPLASEDERMNQKTEDREQGREDLTDMPDNVSGDDTALPQDMPEKNADLDGPPDRAEQGQGKGHGPLKGTDTQATTDLSYIDREKGKRTTM
jgi:hypothetical protein